MGTPEEKLNKVLEGELAAVETYNMALDKIKTPETSAVLCEIRDCHVARVEKIREFMGHLGAAATTKSGPWGSFAKLVEAGAAALGEGNAVGALKEGEDQGLDSYRGAAKHMDDASDKFVAENLLPAQEKTQRKIAALTEAMPA